MFYRTYRLISLVLLPGGFPGVPTLNDPLAQRRLPERYQAKFVTAVSEDRPEDSALTIIVEPEEAAILHIGDTYDLRFLNTKPANRATGDQMKALNDRKAKLIAAFLVDVNAGLEKEPSVRVPSHAPKFPPGVIAESLERCSTIASMGESNQTFARDPDTQKVSYTRLALLENGAAIQLSSDRPLPDYKPLPDGKVHFFHGAPAWPMGETK